MRQLAEHAKCSPDKIDEEQLRQWFLHLKVDKQLAYGSLRVAFSGVKFFFTRTCKRNWKTLTDTKLQNVKLVWQYRDWVYWLGCQPEPPQVQTPTIRCKQCGGDLELRLILGQRGQVLYRTPLASQRVRPPP